MALDLALPTLPRRLANMLRPLGLALCLSVAAATAPALAQAQAPAQTPASGLTAEQRKAVVALIRETLLQNPELIQEALVELERRNTLAQAEAQRSAVTAEKAKLIDPATSAIVGNPQGDVTIVEFMDYNCGFCKRALEDVRALAKEDPKLKVVIKDFPILGPDSVEASRVAVAAMTQLTGAKYFDFHNKLMGVKGRINGAKALEIAKESGADIERLKKEMDSAQTKAVIEDTVALGDRLGLTGTPAFILGDEVIFGAVGQAALKQKIEAVRKCGKATCNG
ncbi:MAG TPA: DsbA family protein [Bosea sp. (in: a-proteobacteria)]|jgi:protein-disulfide isomerase|uniref:DsbA family protein n=1 Tax=Bosea sp. (in: a-proteobacteria) TaxID=1871050 RepID=UPI002E0D4F19|nr:DsbA family protein [Bosea sp. (in: a-proteobacteria)]